MNEYNIIDEEKLRKVKNEISNFLGGYKISKTSNLITALTRQSAIEEGDVGARSNSYQRLEFIGDSILNLIITKLIFIELPNHEEDKKSELRKLIINNKTLGTVGLTYNNGILGKLLIMGRGEEIGNVRHNEKALADLIESLIGFVYLDSNKNFDETEKVVKHILKDEISKSFSLFKK